MWARQQFELIGYKAKASVQKNDWCKPLKKNYGIKKKYFEDFNGKQKKQYLFESEKSDFLEYYSDEEQIKSYDFQDLENQLKDIGTYKLH